MTIGEILNLVSCGLLGSLGTGTKGCKPFFKKVTAVWLTPQGFVYDSARNFDETYAQELQASGDLIILKGVRTFTDNTGDDTIDELEDGTKQVARLGLYEFAIQFVNGMYFHAALHSLNSFSTYDATFIDREGNVLGTKASDGGLKGFTVGMLQGTKFSWATDAQGEREGIMMQLLERSEFDNDFYFIDNANLQGYNPNRTDGVNELDVSYGVAPAAGTSITVKVKRKQDGKPFTGLVFGDFLHTVNGATDNPTAGTDAVTAGTYVLTVTAYLLDDALSTRVYDNAGNNPAVLLAGDLYKSNVASATSL